MKLHHVIGLVLVVTLLACDQSAAVDWPMWRHDAGRSGATSTSLPASLELRWKLHLPEPDPAWPEEQGKVRFDESYNVIVAAGRLIVPSMVAGHVTAYDASNGARLWRFYTDGPVRFAAAASAELGAVLFGSDDGHLYCLDAESGSLRWKRRGGPDDRRVLGNDRLISMWPIRGAPVIDRGKVYFAAGIWPFMGIFIHAVDIETGQIVWTNSGSGSDYIVQQHNSPAFAGVAPQGYLAIAGDTLLVAGGMTVPAAFELATGKFRYFRPGDRVLGKDPGGYEVIARDDWFVNHGGLYRLADGQPLVDLAVRAVNDDWAIAQDAQQLRVVSTSLSSREATIKDKRGRKRTVEKIELSERFTASLPTSVSRVFCMTADHLVASDGDKSMYLVSMPQPESSNAANANQALATSIDWQTSLAAPVWDAIVADDRMYVVDIAGTIYCYDATEGSDFEPVILSEQAATAATAEATQPSPGIDAWLQYTSAREGYAVTQAVDLQLLAQLVEKTNFHIIALAHDPERLAELRRAVDHRGWLGSRIAVVPHHINDRHLPPYLAELIVIGNGAPAADTIDIGAVYRSLRPYGGVAAVACSGPARQHTVSTWAAERDVAVEWSDAWSLLRRPGALNGSASWTHQNADAANSLVSQDRLVRSPMGLLWFGGPSNRDVLPRHGHGPVPQVVGGRLFIEGEDMLRAVDVYTGRLLWQRELPDLGIYYSNTGHHPGAGAIGSNYVSVSDGIYVIWGRRCLRLDPVSGKTMGEFSLPADDSGDRPVWGFVAVDGDYLIAGSSPMVLLAETSSYPTRKTVFTRFGEGSHGIVVMNRHTGKVLWQREAEFNFRHNAIAIADGKLFCIDRMTPDRLAQLQRRGRKPDGRATLLALDLEDGREIWKMLDGVFGTWLAYSARHDVLLQAGSKNRDRATDETGSGLSVYAADTGERLWHSDVAYGGPPLLHGDDIITQGAAFDLMSGQPKQRTHPLTGESQTWKFTRNYGCTTAIGCVNMLTFRSAAAGYFDLATDQGTGNWGGFRSSCTANLIPADGVLSAPDYTRTCTCSYQNQCSLALIHMPDVETWTFSALTRGRDRVKRVGINFGAPGDRLAANGTLWLDYPSVGGHSPDLPVTIDGEDITYSRVHSSLVPDADPRWVFASQARGVRQMRIALAHSSQEAPGERYQVRLYFANGEESVQSTTGKVRLQGRKHRHRADGPVVTFADVEIGHELSLSLETARPLCGIEIVHNSLVND